MSTSRHTVSLSSTAACVVQLGNFLRKLYVHPITYRRRSKIYIKTLLSVSTYEASPSCSQHGPGCSKYLCLCSLHFFCAEAWEGNSSSSFKTIFRYSLLQEAILPPLNQLLPPPNCVYHFYLLLSLNILLLYVCPLSKI